MSHPTQDLAHSFSQVQQVLHEDLQHWFFVYRSEYSDIDPWSAQAIDWLEEYCLRPGKAVRPWLVAVGAAASQSLSLAEVLEQPKVRRLMCFVELTHKRILMADDVADSDDERNGGPSMHKKIAAEIQAEYARRGKSDEFITHTARSYTEVAGIWLQTMSYGLLHRDSLWSAAEFSQIMPTIEKSLYFATAAGWYSLLDQNTLKLKESADESAKQRLLRGFELVTGEYTFVAPLTLGASTGEKFSELPIQRFSLPAGVLFQITDDLLNIYGDVAETGKSSGGDIREGKKTLLVQQAYIQSSESNQEKLSSLVGKEDITEDQISWVKEVFESTQSDTFAKQEADEKVNQALGALSTWDHSQTRSLLEQLVTMIRHRKS